MLVKSSAMFQFSQPLVSPSCLRISGTKKRYNFLKSWQLLCCSCVWNGFIHMRFEICREWLWLHFWGILDAFAGNWIPPLVIRCSYDLKCLCFFFFFFFLAFLWLNLEVLLWLGLVLWSWELASALKESKSKFDSAGVKLIAIGVGEPKKARILADRV